MATKTELAPKRFPDLPSSPTKVLHPPLQTAGYCFSQTYSYTGSTPLYEQPNLCLTASWIQGLVHVLPPSLSPTSGHPPATADY